MSVQFDPLSTLAPVHLGRWWTGARRAHYPVTEERPSLEPTREDFEAPSSAGPSFNLRVMGAPPTPSVWFLTEDRSELLQVQRDRFTRNWSKQSAKDPYPSFDALWPAFADDFGQFRDFLVGESIGDPSIIQCELTYVNPIDPGGWERHGQLHRVVAPWSGSYSEGFLPEPEDGQIVLRYRIPGPEGSPVGRLHVTVQPSWVEGPKPRLLMTLTARGRPLGAGLSGAKAFLDLGHEWIVRAFTTLTEPPMHEQWERYQ
jgi:uncharacterized protein (TIGR04255 family)